MKRSLGAAAALLALVRAPVVSAQEADKAQPVDDLDLVKLLNVQVSTATKTAESLDEAPAVITAVTREEIHRWGYRSVAEVLNHCVGFYSIDDHIMPNVGVRGMTGGLGAESGVIKVMIDGRSVAYRTTSGEWLGVELVPLESIKQIEIIRGPASALYGADAFLGVVNIITESPDEARPVRVRAFTGFSRTNPSQQIDMAVNAKVNRFDFLLGAAGEFGSRSGLKFPSESPSSTFPSYVGNRRTADNLDRRSLSLQGRVGYRVPDAGHLIVSTYLSGFERGGDFAPWAQLTNGTDAAGRKVGTVVSQGQIRINADGLIHASKSLDLALQSTYFEGRTLAGDRTELGSDLWYARRKDRYRGVDSVAEVRYFPTARFNVIVGAETVFDHEYLPAPQRISKLTDQPLATESAGRRVELFNVGAFLSTNVTVIEQWLKLTGGIRYDNHSIYGGQLTGRFGATSRWSKSVVVKALYGSAFKAPSPYLLYAEPLRPGDVEGNPNLKPQKIHTTELQISWKPNTFFGLTSSVSYNWLLDKAEFFPQGINLVARNAASQRTFSWETRADVKHYDDYSAYLSGELVQSVRDLGREGYTADLVGNRNVAYPSYIARGGLLVGIPSPPSFPLSAGAEAMVVGPRHAADASVLERGQQFDLKAYPLVNLWLTTRDVYLFPGHESRIALRAYNLFAARGPDPGFSGFEYPLAPREVFLELQHTY